MQAERVGTGVVMAGIVLLAATLSVSAALAPDVASREADPVGPDGDTPRATLVGSQGGGAGWHRYGSVYRLDGTRRGWAEGSADSYFDVTKLEDGRVLAGFMHSGYERCGPYDAPCTRTGFRVIDPDAAGGPRVVEEYSFPVRTDKNSEVHDAEPLPSGEILVTDMEHERVFTVRDGELTWQWNASSFYEAPPDPTRTDWLHINDADHIGGERYLVSVRNANQLLVIERGTGVVEVVNADEPRAGSDGDGDTDESCVGRGQLADRDGDSDVRCGDPAVLNHQHNPQWLGDGVVLVADSDNDRVVELRRNGDGEWQPGWTLRRAGGVAFDWPRDADRLANGNTLITDTLNRRIVEVNRSGAVVWAYRTPRIPYEADRLPEGERPSGTAYSVTSGGSAAGTASPTPSAADGDVPGLSIALVGLRALYPQLPFWFGELQLALALVSVALIGGGVGLRWRG